MHIDPALTRRTLLVGAAATAGAAALAACSGGSDASSKDSRISAASSPDTSPSASSAASAGSSGGSGTESLAALADLTVGEPKTVDLPDGKKGLLTRTSQTAVACFSTVCTHEGCTVKPDGTKLACPCHGSVFEAATGKPISGPAPSALATIAVKIIDGRVVAG